MSESQIKVGIAIENSGRLLLLEEWSNKKNGYFWNIVKGTYGDVDNETLFDCALRECEEEVGMRVKLVSVIVCSVENSGKNKLQLNFLAHPLKNENIKTPEKKDQESRNEDIGKIGWFSKDQVRKLGPEEFISPHSYIAVKKWLKGVFYPLDLISEILR